MSADTVTAGSFPDHVILEEVKKETDEEEEEMEEKKEEAVAAAPTKSHTDAIDHVHWLIEYVEGSRTMYSSPPYA